MKRPSRPEPLRAAKSQQEGLSDRDARLVGQGFHPTVFHVPIFVILTPVLPERRRTENLTSRADRFPPMPPRSEPPSEQCGRICGLPLFEPKVETASFWQAIIRGESYVGEKGQVIFVIVQPGMVN